MEDAADEGVELIVVKHHEAKRGFVLLPRRCVVERTFGWIVPIPGTTRMAHMLDNSGADAVRFTPAELAELNAAVRAMEVKGQHLPDQVLISAAEGPPKQ